MNERDRSEPAPGRRSAWELAATPPFERWDDWRELDASAWPERRQRSYRIVPTICFNCESACGLLAWVDDETGDAVRFEGNPLHPGSRGRTCAKGPATASQVRDPERITRPLRRDGPRGSGRFRPVSWREAIDEIATRIRRAFDDERHDEVMYHVGRPGEDHFALRVLAAWGIDGHNSHTNVCSAAARTGYALWGGFDRPSPDYESARFILLLSSHLETGHYFNPHAQRIVDAHQRGARVAVVDPRLSNTAARAEMWISPWPGTEATLLCGVARELIRTGRIDRDFLRDWIDWRGFLARTDPDGPGGFDRFLERIAEIWDPYDADSVAAECRIPAETIGRLADEIAAAGSRFASHLWRGAAAGHLGGWQVTRALVWLHALTGSIGTPGGLRPAGWDKFVPKPSAMPPPPARWNELIWPLDYPLAHYEMSYLLPYLLEESGRRLEVYFTRVYNPVWTNPDGTAWIEMLEDEERVGCHVALTPIWSETAQWADFVLPMGLGPERHDVMSQETHAGRWIGFRQPVRREWMRRRGEAVDTTLGCNPGEVWEEAEFWIHLSWAIDPDGRRGIRRWFESPARPGEPITLDEYFADLFDHSVPGLADAARDEGMSPIEYMRRRGAFSVPEPPARHDDPAPDGGGVALEDGRRVRGFSTPSGKLELHSETLVAWGHPEHALPGPIRSHVHWSEIDLERGERVLLPTFRLPTLIHTRSGNAKWLVELSHTNPLWVGPDDARALGLADGDLVRVSTRIGYFVNRVWVTEAIRPGVVACSHHLGRWRLGGSGGGRWGAGSRVRIERGDGTFLLRIEVPPGPFASADPDTRRVWWREAGVHQNLAFPVQPDPVSGMHCWHQKVIVERAHPGDRYGDVFVDRRLAREVHSEWRARARPGPGPGGLRRPAWLNRPHRPAEVVWRVGTPPPARD